MRFGRGPFDSDSVVPRIVGVNPDFPDVHPSRDWDHLRDLYRSYRMYVHTAQQGMEDAWNTSTLANAR